MSPKWIGDVWRATVHDESLTKTSKNFTERSLTIRRCQGTLSNRTLLLPGQMRRLVLRKHDDFTIFLQQLNHKNEMYSSQTWKHEHKQSEPKRWGRKHCMHIRKTESLRRPATFEPLDKHMISAGTNFRFASFVQQELQLQFEFLT